jgi:hypothetical protein
MKSAVDAFEAILAALDKLEIRYAIGGSFASSTYGNYRYTNDIDIVVQIPDFQVAEFAAALGPEFYCDIQAMREGFRLGRPANVVHKPSVFKFDLFPAGENRFRLAELNRRVFKDAPFVGRLVECAIVTPEDAILAKLNWIRLSGGGSEKQLNDILGVIAVQGDKLDRAYMAATAAELGLSEELNRLFD